MTVKPTILFALLPGIERIAEHLLDRADADLIVLYDMAHESLEAQGIPSRRLTAFLSDEQRTRAADEAARRAQAAAIEFNSSSMREQWPQYDDRTWERLRAMLIESLRRSFFNEIVYINAVRRCVSETDLRLVVVQHDICRDTRTVVHTARRLGIPALHLLHGVPCGCVTGSTLGKALSADVVAVFSEYAKKVYESFGIRSDRIVVTGNPQWDVHLRPPALGFKEYACETAGGLDPTRPIIVYGLTFGHRFSVAGATNFHFGERITDAVLAAFAVLEKKHPDWQFVVRPHPNDNRPPKDLEIRAQNAGLGRVCVDKTTGGLACAIMADLVLCVESNLGIEAILAGKPVINCALEEYCRDFFTEGLGPLFRDTDAAVTARRPAEIAAAVETALLDPAVRRRFIEKRPDTIRRFNYSTDGKATDRVCALIIEMLEKSHTYVSPPARYPEFERAMAKTVPPECKRVLVAGRAAQHVADSLAAFRSDVSVEAAAAIHSAPLGWDAIVLSDPLPHTEAADALLARAESCLNGQQGSLIVSFRSGRNQEACDAIAAGDWSPARCQGEPPSSLGQYSRWGLEVALMRCGFDLERVVELTNAKAGPDFFRAAPPQTANSQPDIRLGSAKRELGVSGDVSPDSDFSGSAIEGWVVHARVRREALRES